MSAATHRKAPNVGTISSSVVNQRSLVMSVERSWLKSSAEPRIQRKPTTSAVRFFAKKQDVRKAKATCTLA